MFRVDVDLHNTNEDFGCDFTTEAEARYFIEEAMKAGFVIQSRQSGAVKIYHPIASVKKFTVKAAHDKSKMAPR